MFKPKKGAQKYNITKTLKSLMQIYWQQRHTRTACEWFHFRPTVRAYSHPASASALTLCEEYIDFT